MHSLVRLLVALALAFVTFVVAFLAVFIPMLIKDMRDAPHDGQGGMGGFLLGIPIGAVAALVAGAAFYVGAEQRNWFSKAN